MGRFFIPRHWRLPSVLWGLIIFELPFTVANLTLFGIAQPNLYRTILWKQGGDLGFNSDPTTVLYAAANYRPVETPIVWSQFKTDYNVVVGVFCMFLWLVKTTMFSLHWFFPIIALPVHIAELVLWSYSIYAQTAPDTIDPDPKRHNNGAPWYITKSCNIVSDDKIKGYCMQAKSSFAVSIIMLVIFVAATLLTLYSLYPTAAARERHAAKVAERKAEKEKWDALMSPTYGKEMSAEEQWQHMWELQQLPRTPGTAGGMKSPTTPRTMAWRALDGEAAEKGFSGAGRTVPAGWVPAPSSYYEQEIQRVPNVPQQHAAPPQQHSMPEPYEYPAPQQHNMPEQYEYPTPQQHNVPEQYPAPTQGLMGHEGLSETDGKGKGNAY